MGDSARRLEEQQAPLRIEPGEPPRPRVAGHALVVSRRVVAEERQAEAVLAVRLAVTRTRVASGPRQDRHHVLREIPASFRPGEDRHPARRLFVPQRRPDRRHSRPERSQCALRIDDDHPRRFHPPGHLRRQVDLATPRTDAPSDQLEARIAGRERDRSGTDPQPRRRRCDGSRRRNHSPPRLPTAPGVRGAVRSPTPRRASTHLRNRAPRSGSRATRSISKADWPRSIPPAETVWTPDGLPDKRRWLRPHPKTLVVETQAPRPVSRPDASHASGRPLEIRRNASNISVETVETNMAVRHRGTHSGCTEVCPPLG